jgi:hypothetical protein
MTHEQILGEIRTQSEAISERKIMDEQIKFWIFHAIGDICAQTECCQQAYDYTITEENDEWRTDYPLPGFEAGLAGGETYPYAENTYAGSTFKRAKRLYIDGELAEYTSIDRILDPAGSAPPTLGTDTQGEAISGTIFSGEGSDATKQYWTIKYNKFWSPYPPVEEAVSARLHYIWVPNHAFKTAIEAASGAPSRIEIAQRVPENYHEAIVNYGLYKLFSLHGKEYHREANWYKRAYDDVVNRGAGTTRSLGTAATVRGNYY